MKQLKIPFLILICILSATTNISAQINLLINPNADSETNNWSVFKQAAVEEFDGNKVFVIRNQGSFHQDVALSEEAVGKYALFIGRGSSERINADGAITGLPYLYGYMLKSSDAKGSAINAYLQGQQMRVQSSTANEWVKMFGIYRVPEKTTAIRFFLNQAERNGVPQNGSAARFDNLGLYLFETEEKALEFAKAYK